MKFNPLVIGNLVARIPIIQGGMGVGVSLSGLAGSVGKEGAIGIISAAQIGFKEEGFEKNALMTNLKALKKHILLAKEKAQNGIIGVNIMVATTNFEEYVKCSIESGADLIISGAGLPLKLPQIIGDANIKFAPIVSSVRACKLLFSSWEKRYNRVSDFVVVEGPKAGGHLGFKPEEVLDPTMDFDQELKNIIEYVKEYETKSNKKIPVVFAGGIYDQEDIAHYIEMGCGGVQMGTRFVATEECDAHPSFKQAYLDATKESIGIVKSPVGMPGRALINPFTETVAKEKEDIKKCYNCLTMCKPKEVPYCITNTLMNAVKGDTENALVFCGSNAYRVDKITTVKELLDELVN